MFKVENGALNMFRRVLGADWTTSVSEMRNKWVSQSRLEYAVHSEIDVTVYLKATWNGRRR